MIFMLDSVHLKQLLLELVLLDLEIFAKLEIFCEEAGWHEDALEVSLEICEIGK